MRLANLLLAAVLIGGGLTASAQEGHPIKGSWIGVWDSNEIHGDDVLVVMDWDGKSITGIINPGTDNIPISSATLDPDDWSVRIEAEADDGSGGKVHYVIEGKIQDLELPNRYIVGTWRNERGHGDFEIRRQ